MKATYAEQGPPGKILFATLALLILCCPCAVLLSLLPGGSGSSPAVTPGPAEIPSTGTQSTPTALFGLGGTPFPTLAPPSPLPTTPVTSTFTPVPPTATPILPTVTASPLPTGTNPPPTPTAGGTLRILTVDKPTEYVDIQNVGPGPVDLSGWQLVSETGRQTCRLRGTLDPQEALRVWARRGMPGFDCGFAFNIWNDNQPDPAVLYDPQGREISRYP